MGTTREAPISLRLSSELRERVEKQADRSGMKRNAWLVGAVEDALACDEAGLPRHGPVEDEPPAKATEPARRERAQKHKGEVVKGSGRRVPPHPGFTAPVGGPVRIEHHRIGLGWQWRTPGGTGRICPTGKAGIKDHARMQLGLDPEVPIELVAWVGD